MVSSLVIVGLVIMVFSIIIMIIGGFLLTSRANNLKTDTKLPKSDPTTIGWITIIAGIIFFFLGAILMLLGGGKKSTQIKEEKKTQ